MVMTLFLQCVIIRVLVFLANIMSFSHLIVFLHIGFQTSLYSAVSMWYSAFWKNLVIVLTGIWVREIAESVS